MDEFYMKIALENAKKGIGKVSPNPMVGAVIVKNEKIIGIGFHEYYGGNHAEVNAFKNAIEDVTGATMYVTLEPCSHYGKTPPCADKIIEKKIKRVVIGTLDPNSLVAGNGVKKLTYIKSLGIKVLIVDEKEKRVNLNSLMKTLGEMNIDSILLEGGGTLNFSALKENIVDKVQVYIASKIIGGASAKTPVEGAGIDKLNKAFSLKELKIDTLGKDIFIEGYLK